MPDLTDTIVFSTVNEFPPDEDSVMIQKLDVDATAPNHAQKEDEFCLQALDDYVGAMFDETISSPFDDF